MAPAVLVLVFRNILMFAPALTLVLVMAIVIPVIVPVNNDHLLIEAVAVPGITDPVIFKPPVCIGFFQHNFVPGVQVIM